MRMRVRNEFFCRRKLIFAVVDCQLCQERTFLAGIDRERLLQQPAEDCLYRVLRVMRRTQIAKRGTVNTVGIFVIERQYLFSFHVPFLRFLEAS